MIFAAAAGTSDAVVLVALASANAVAVAFGWTLILFAWRRDDIRHRARRARSLR